MPAGAGAFAAADREHAAELFHDGIDPGHAHAPSRCGGHTRPGAEPVLEHDPNQIGTRIVPQAARSGELSNAGPVDAAPVVLDLQRPAAFALRCAQDDLPAGALAARLTLGGRFDAVIDRVPDQVNQRRPQWTKPLAVDAHAARLDSDRQIALPHARGELARVARRTGQRPFDWFQGQRCQTARDLVRRQTGANIVAQLAERALGHFDASLALLVEERAEDSLDLGPALFEPRD